MDVKDWISLVTLLGTIFVGIYVVYFKGQIDENLKRMETRIHYEKWLIDAKAKALTEYWDAINFFPRLFALVFQSPDQRTVHDFRVEAYLRMHYSYLTLKLYYDDFDDLHKTYSHNSMEILRANRQLLRPEGVDRDVMRELEEKYKVHQTSEEIHGLIRAAHDDLYKTKGKPRAKASS